MKCPYLYSKCRKCDGLRRVWEANTQANKGRRFLRCQNQPKCNEFEWLDKAAVTEIPKTEKQQLGDGCFKCGSDSHWVSQCPEASPASNKKITPIAGLDGCFIKGKYSIETHDMKMVIDSDVSDSMFAEICDRFKGAVTVEKGEQKEN